MHARVCSACVCVCSTRRCALCIAQHAPAVHVLQVGMRRGLLHCLMRLSVTGEVGSVLCL